MAKVLITGASGFVGNNLARFLVQSGHEVHLMLRSEHLDWRLQDIRDHVGVAFADLRDPESVTRSVKQVKPEWVFHLAAYGAYSFQTSMENILRTNIIGTANLVQACLKTGFEAFVNTGSSSEYGFKDHAPPEHELPEPNSHYAVSKVSATMFCRYTAVSTGARIPTLRLYSVYGPYEEPRRLMPTLILAGLEKHLPPLVNPDTARDYVYVDDVVRAYLMAASAPNQEPGAIYNVGTGVETSLGHVVKVATRVLGITTKPNWGSMESRIWDTNRWVADNNRIRKALGWQPEHSFESGFRAMVEWFLEHEELTAKYRELTAQSAE
jgi:UDP-glucose 4-epimerase